MPYRPYLRGLLLAERFEKDNEAIRRAREAFDEARAKAELYPERPLEEKATPIDPLEKS